LITLTLLTAYLGRLKVVIPDSLDERKRDFTSMVIGLTYRGRVLEIALDLFLISITYYLAFWIHFGTQVEIINLEIFLSSLPIALVGSYVAFLIFGIYRGVWQYLDIRDLLRYGRAVLGAVLLTAIIMSWVYYPLGISFRIFVIFAVLLFLGLVISRSSFTILDRVYSQQIRDPKQYTKILIYGAGEGGVMILRWLSQSTDHRLNPVGFLDDDPFKQGRQILGIRVLGSINDLSSILEQTAIEGILISSENALNHKGLDALKTSCQDLGIWLKRMRIEFDVIE
jgi:UDP-GlcNAc:undecaprenyl-phosphate GlcNAc-1-phosphate transferase